jgi:hypothetical protein
MPRGRDEAGNIWELDAQGNPVRLVQPVQASAPGALAVVPPNPALVAKAQAEQQRQAASDRRAEQANQRAAQAEARAQKKFESEDTMAPPPGDTSKTGEEYLATIPPSLAGQVKAMAEGRRAFPTGAALRSPAVQQLIAAATQYDPTLDAANAATRVATRKDFTSGKSAQNITALNTVLGHLGSLWQSAQDLHNRGLVPWNAIANAAESTVGNPHLNNYNLARKAVADELERVFRQSGGNVSEIQEWKSTLSSSSSPEQFRGAMAKAVELLNSRLESLGAQYSQGMGRSADPMTFLKPHAQAVFQALQTGGNGILPGAAPPPGPLTPGGGPPKPPGGVPRADFSSMVGGPDQTLATGGFRNVFDPVAAKALSAFIRNGADYETVAAFARSHGFNPPDSKAYASAVSYQQANPGSTPNVEADRTVSTTLGERLASSPLSAAIVGAGAGATAGLSDVAGRTLAGPEWDANRAALSATQPGADIIGNVIGGGAGLIGGGALLGKAAPGALAMLSKAPALVKDAAYGGIYGANESPDAPGYGAAAGALAAAGGGLAGRKLASGLAGVISPSAGPFAPLYEQGGFPTIGQKLGATGGLAGKIANIGEQALQSFPGLGMMVHGARQGVRDVGQIGAFNRSLKPLEDFESIAGDAIPTALPKGVGPGAEAHSITSDAFSKAYDIARSGMQFVPDTQYLADHNAFSQTLNSGVLSGPQASQVQQVINSAIGSRLPAQGGALSGDAYKAASRDLTSAIHSWASNPDTAPMASALSDYQTAFDNAARRNSNPQAVKLLDAADRGYAQFVRIQRASEMGGAAKDAGTFTPANYAGAVKQMGGGVRSNAYNRGNALGQDYAEALLPLRDTLPTSGTSERLLTSQAIAGLGGGEIGAGGFLMAHPGSLAPFAAYVPGVRDVVNRAIAPNAQRLAILPPNVAATLDRIGAQIDDLAPLVGKTAMPGSLAYFGVGR